MCKAVFMLDTVHLAQGVHAKSVIDYPLQHVVITRVPKACAALC